MAKVYDSFDWQIGVNDPERGRLVWTPDEHTLDHLAGLSPEEQAVIRDQVAATLSEYARLLTETVCVTAGVLDFRQSQRVDLEAFQGPGPSFWHPPVQPRKLDWKAIFN